jgi:hypothetical protein
MVVDDGWLKGHCWLKGQQLVDELWGSGL